MLLLLAATLFNPRIYAGWSERKEAMFEFWKARVAAALNEPDPPLPPKKIFSPKNTLPNIADYSVAASDKFWAAFPTNPKLTGKSSVSSTRLRFWANAIGCGDRERLEAVCRDLDNGADIGCRGDPRNASFSSNAPSAFECGAEVTDAIATWVKQGIVAGPLDPGEWPQMPRSAVSCAG